MSRGETHSTIKNWHELVRCRGGERTKEIRFQICARNGNDVRVRVPRRHGSAAPMRQISPGSAPSSRACARRDHCPRDQERCRWRGRWLRSRGRTCGSPHRIAKALISSRRSVCCSFRDRQVRACGLQGPAGALPHPRRTIASAETSPLRESVPAACLSPLAVYAGQRPSRACARSATMSSRCSIPIERRTKPGVTPADS